MAPPSVLPDISPTRREIGRHCGFRQSPTFFEQAMSAKLPVSPQVGEMSGRTEGGASLRHQRFCTAAALRGNGMDPSPLHQPKNAAVQNESISAPSRQHRFCAWTPCRISDLKKGQQSLPFRRGGTSLTALRRRPSCPRFQPDADFSEAL
ncbi:MAG: hypothetical protein EOR84_31325 [Mesorhizobium sp.]|nr:MAG: hypothetical protein EOR84_31325 [Mesorhizobium sp.]